MLDDRHGVFALRFGSLADDLTGDDEIEALVLDPFTRLAHHEHLAVEAGVEVRAVAVTRVEDHVFVFFDDVNDMQLDTELLGNPERVVAFLPVAVFLTDGVGVPFDTETGEEIDALDVDALSLNDLGRQQRIEAAGDQCQCLALFSHGRSVRGENDTLYL